MEEGEGQSITCAAHECDILVDDATVMRLVGNSKVKLRYQQLVTKSFVECNRLLRWCSSPGCNDAIKVQFVEAWNVTCKCSHTFCFACGEKCHDPVKCHLLRKWFKEYDFETYGWIASNTKNCPKCKTSIEKSGGCNQMVCRNKNCGARFCWACLRLLTSHNICGLSCNQWQADTSSAQEKSSFADQRHLFYMARYDNHMKSLDFEHKLYYSLKKVEEMEQGGMSYVVLQFLKSAVDTLYQCRQTLIYTYVFAYYLRENNQSLIFIENQRNLESATESLSEYLEKNIASKISADIEPEVLNKYLYCKARRKVFLDHVNEGHDKDWWEYRK
jgi:ariadne-1